MCGICKLDNYYYAGGHIMKSCVHVYNNILYRFVLDCLNYYIPYLMRHILFKERINNE